MVFEIGIEAAGAGALRAAKFADDVGDVAKLAIAAEKVEDVAGVARVGALGRGVAGKLAIAAEKVEDVAGVARAGALGRGVAGKRSVFAGAHEVFVSLFRGEKRMVLCSTNCGELARKVDAMLEPLATDHPAYGELKSIRDRARPGDKRLNLDEGAKDALTEADGTQLAEELSGELEALGKKHDGVVDPNAAPLERQSAAGGSPEDS